MFLGTQFQSAQDVSKDHVGRGEEGWKESVASKYPVTTALKERVRQFRSLVGDVFCSLVHYR